MTRCTVSGNAPLNDPSASVPRDEKRPDGQHVDHWVLCAEERAKGFVRPVRRSYVHVGVRPKYPTRHLTAEEQKRYGQYGYVCFEPYPESQGAGRFWTQAWLDSGCGDRTTMPMAIAETYARQPGYYGSTFCCRCGGYFPVGAKGEFVWDGTNERVGT